jgi:transcriptional regulator with XRE-family HTH domain
MASRELLLFGENVRSVRKRTGISQEELADRAGLHRTYIGGIERGERNIGLINLLRIAQALNVPPAQLLSGFRKMPRNA